MSTSPSVKTRRRGAELEQAIVEVAWDILWEHGYADLTMEAVAAAANTSRSVLARRWGSKAELAIAAIRWRIGNDPWEVPDRGALRTELLEYLYHLREVAPVLGTIFYLLSTRAFQEEYASAEKLREAIGRNDPLIPILRRAVDRGEIDQAKLIAPIKTLPTDLIRHYVLMNRTAPPKALCATWIDVIFLPLVQPD